MDHKGASALGLIALAALAWGMATIGQPFAEPAIFAAAMASTLWGVGLWLRSRLGRRLAALALSCVLSLGVSAPACWAWSSSFAQIDGMIANAPGGAPLLGEPGDAMAWIEKAKSVGMAKAKAARQSPAWQARAVEAGSVPWGRVGLMGIMLYFMFADGALAMAWLVRVALSRGGSGGPALLSAGAVAFVQTSKGCVWFGGASFVILWGLFAWAGAPSPMALAVAGACASMLPFVAPVMVAALALALLSPANIAGPVALLLLGAGGLGVANNILRPKWVGDASGLSMPAALLGMAGGAMAWGPAGLLAGPAIVAIALHYVQASDLPQSER